MKGAIFLDRDGTLNENAAPHEYIMHPEDFHFLPGVLDALGFLAKNSERAFVICANQACVGKGLCDVADVAMVHVRMMEGIGRVCGRLPRVYACTHVEEDGCFCRKPKPGLFIRAAKDLSLDLSDSYVVGDWSTDLRAGWAAGIPVENSYLVLTGLKGRGKYPDKYMGRYHIHSDLMSAAQAIVLKEQA